MEEVSWEIITCQEVGDGFGIVEVRIVAEAAVVVLGSGWVVFGCHISGGYWSRFALLFVLLRGGGRDVSSWWLGSRDECEGSLGTGGAGCRSRILNGGLCGRNFGGRLEGLRTGGSNNRSGGRGGSILA